MTPQVIGWRLARARQEAGLRQADLATRMGTTQSSISRIEGGRFVPSIEVIDRYARALGQPITLTFGAEKAASRKKRRERVRAVLGDYRFDPWDRDPTPAEERTLIADGLTARSR